MTPEEVRGSLEETVFGHVQWLATTGSTNADLAAAARSGAAEGTVLVADHQTAGRGRHGRPWVAPPGAALLASVLLRPRGSVIDPVLLSPATALAVRDACASFGPKARLKWPNDVIVTVAGEPPGTVGQSTGTLRASTVAESGNFATSSVGTATEQAKPAAAGWCHEAKLAGVLAELHAGTGGTAVVVGFGVNLGSQAALRAAVAEERGGRFENDFEPLPPVALESVADRAPDRDELLVSVLRGLDTRYRRLGESQGRWDLLEELRRRSATLGREVRVLTPGGLVEGRAEDLTADGNLIVVTAEGSVTIAAGDCHHLRSERA